MATTPVITPFPIDVPGMRWRIESEPRQPDLEGERGYLMFMIPIPWYRENEAVFVHRREFLNIDEAYPKIFTFHYG